MGKKFILLSMVLGIGILSCIGIFIYDKKTNSIVNGESNKNRIEPIIQQEDILKPENNIENAETNNIKENINKEKVKEKEPVLEEKTKGIQENNGNTSTKKETTTNTKREIKQEKIQSPLSSNKQENKSEVVSEQPTTSSDTNNGYTEQEVQIAPPIECIGNNHKIAAGNTGKWFNTQAEAGEYFKTEIKKWGDKWENFKIEDEEYYKNCPYGYEVWTCPQCQKWTINFYYNK